MHSNTTWLTGTWVGSSARTTTGFSSRPNQRRIQEENKPRHDNHYQPPCFDDFPQLQHQLRDRRSPSLVVVHALIVLQDMAESIIIHFNELDPSVVLSRIQGKFGARNHQTWSFPADDYLILVYPYDDFESEYEASERDEVWLKLGGNPTASFAFEIRRSRSDDACDVLERFVRADLRDLKFVVDDMWRLISSNDLEGVSDFLDCYRYKKLAEQAAS
jgi:hypothetical protein